VATCTDCHGSHKVLSALQPEAELNVLNISKTCGKCHESDAEEYHESIHWFSLEHGHYESPTCTDCHGEHEIENPHGDPDAATLKSTEICASCHSSETLMNRFGLDHRRLDSYMKSYHGLAALKDSPEAATCTSCHEVHAIRTQSDSTSSVHASNLVATCGKCHDEPTEAFVNIDVHPVDQKSRNPIAFLFKNLYTWMIILTIGGMVAHNIIIVVHHVRERRKLKQGSVLYQRFQPFEVYQHMLLFLSFATLVVTGFALKFPEAGWVQILLKIGLDEGLRSLLHRIAAVVMVIISVVQLFYFLFSKKGRRDMLALVPKIEDFTHFAQNMGYHLGFSKKHPQYGRYDYTEKAEYLALIWGILVMGVTGFILWFPEFFFKFLPSWLFETAEVIHYYEAWLATLAILVWHWFFVIFHPEKYPMNTTWTDGKITIDELKEHHPAEYEEYMNTKDPSAASQHGANYKTLK
jgi:cytochrome b subunit of formate dehydrogenase